MKQKCEEEGGGGGGGKSEIHASTRCLNSSQIQACITEYF
jgi:hypothetical protein